MVGSGVPCLSSKMSEMPSKLAFEWSCASKIRSAHESINDECVDGTESQPGHNTHKPGGIPNFGIKTPMIPAFDSWVGTIPFQSLKRTTMVTAKENLLLGALAFRGTCSRGATVLLKLTGGSSDRDSTENYKRGKLHRERIVNTRGESNSRSGI